MRKKLLAVLSLALLTSGARAEDLVITANRAPVAPEAVNEDYKVITKEEIKKKGLTSVADVLKYVSGVHVASNGGFGQPTSVFILGLPSKHVLVMVNGNPIYDPSTPEGTANFEWIDLSNIERIEVIKGPQGALYGSDAIGGVINIITKKPKESSFKASVEAGKYLTFKERIGGALTTDRGFLSFNFTNFKTNGFSAANEKSPVYEPDSDGFRYRTGWLSWGYRPADWLKLTGDFKLKGGSVDFDANNPNPQYAVVGAKTDYDNFFADLKADATITDSLGLTVTASHNKEDRDTPWGLYRGIVRYFSLQPIYYLTESTFITGGVNYRQEKAQFSDKASAHLRSAFAELHTSLYGLTATAAVRRDLHSEYGGKTTYKLSAGYLFRPTGTKIRAQYGTGFRAPSLYQLYGPWVGNQELKAETSEGWNAGIDQKIPYLKGQISITYFKNHVWNLIDMPWWQGIYTYKNYNRAVTEGAEIDARVKISENLALFGNYTHLRAKEFNPTTGSWEKLARRPKFSYTVGVEGSFMGAKASLWALHYSDREDANGKTLGGFTTLNCYASYKFENGIEVFAKGINLTDKDYQLAYGYNTMGRALFVGASYSFK